MNHFLQARFRIVEKQQRKEILPGNIPRSNAKELLSGLERRHLYLPSRISSWLWTCEGPCSSCLSKWEFHWLYWICYPWVWWMCVWRTEACSSEFTSHQVTLRGRPPLDLPERSLDLESLVSLCVGKNVHHWCAGREWLGTDIAYYSQYNIRVFLYISQPLFQPNSSVRVLANEMEGKLCVRFLGHRFEEMGVALMLPFTLPQRMYWKWLGAQVLLKQKDLGFLNHPPGESCPQTKTIFNYNLIWKRNKVLF